MPNPGQRGVVQKRGGRGISVPRMGTIPKNPFQIGLKAPTEVDRRPKPLHDLEVPPPREPRPTIERRPRPSHDLEGPPLREPSPAIERRSRPSRDFEVPPREPSPTLAPRDPLTMDLGKLAPEMGGAIDINPSIGLEGSDAALRIHQGADRQRMDQERDALA